MKIRLANKFDIPELKRMLWSYHDSGNIKGLDVTSEETGLRILTTILVGGGLALVAEKDNFFRSFVDKAFNAIWVDSLNMNNEEVFLKFINSHDVNPDLFSLKYNDPMIKNELIKKTNDSFNKGIFGVPTFIVNGKMFWGQDRLEFVFNEAKK